MLSRRAKLIGYFKRGFETNVVFKTTFVWTTLKGFTNIQLIWHWYLEITIIVGQASFYLMENLGLKPRP